MDARDDLTDLVKSIQKNKVNARKEESKGPSGRGRTRAALERACLRCGRSKTSWWGWQQAQNPLTQLERERLLELGADVSAALLRFRGFGRRPVGACEPTLAVRQPERLDSSP
jgi:hypothetical protein